MKANPVSSDQYSEAREKARARIFQLFEGMNCYSGFAWVKDPAKREEMLRDYDECRRISDEFYETHIRPLAGKRELKAASKEFFSSLPTKFERDVLAHEFVYHIDDRGENGVRRIHALCSTAASLASTEEKAAWNIYDSYRFSVIAFRRFQKGLGAKCFDLLTGHEFYLVDRKISEMDFLLGQTALMSLVNMGFVFMSTGFCAPIPMSEEETLKCARAYFDRVGLSFRQPMYLLPDEQFCFFLASTKALQSIRAELVF